MPISGKVEGGLIPQVSLQPIRPPPPFPPREANAGPLTVPVLRAEVRGERLRMREKQRKASVLIGDGQLHHRHNHQHPKGL